MLFRAVTITAIIGLGVVGAYLFLPKTSVDQSVLSSGTTLIEQRIIGATPHVENVTGSPSAFTQSASETLAPNNLSSNLTDQFIEKIKADLIAKNANGPQSIGNALGLLGTEPDDIAAQSLIEAGRLFDPSVLRPTINNSKLTITQDNNASAFTEYLIAFNSVLEATAKKIPDSIFNDENQIGTPETNTQIAQAYQWGFDALIKIKTPS